MINGNRNHPTGVRTRGTGATRRPIHACEQARAKLGAWREQLTQKLTESADTRLPERLVRQAVNEAEALAWSTPYPVLFLPGLVEEKVNNIRNWADRQAEVLERQRALATTVVQE